MALQGDLSSFALPDVLRLLSRTQKSGCLQVTGDDRTGEVWLVDGSMVAGVASTSPHAAAAADVVHELLRLDAGAFVFDDGAELDEEHRREPEDVDEVLAAAEALTAEWEAVEAVIPSMDAWLQLAPEVLDTVTVAVDEWRAIAAIGSGGSVRDLADALELTDLGASHLAKQLVEADLVAVRATHGFARPTVALDDFSDIEVLDDAPGYDPDPMTDLEALGHEDRPVVMEDRDDALLPEPLPGEGVSYEGESISVGSVDGRMDTFEAGDAFGPVDQFDAGHEVTLDPVPEASPIDEDIWYAGDDAETGAHELQEADEHVVAAHDDDIEDELEDELDDAVEDELEDEGAPVAEVATEETSPLEDVSAPTSIGDDERGSLLKFLSTVKP